MRKSFTLEVKSELIARDREEEHAFLAFCYGLFLFASSFSLNAMYLKTENRELANTYAACALRLAGIKVKTHATKGGTYTCEIASAEDRKKVFEAFSLSGKEFTLRINLANIDSENCYADFLAGVFCACGMVANPQKDYHLEFAVSYHQLSKDLIRLMDDTEMDPPLHPKYVVRNYDIVIYFKGSEHIEDLLLLMGASNAAFRVMDAKIEKDFKNKANRLKNCDSANINKTALTGAKQARAMRRIKNKLGFEALPEELRELAQLRMLNPEMSLAELAENLNEPLSRSGVNHRMKRLEAIAEEL